MSRFADVLKDINGKLDLPQPEKSHILLEIASDLEDIYRAYRERGLGEEEARRRAEEKLDLSDEALRELVEIHQSGLRKFLGRISEQARSRWERVLLAMALLFALAAIVITIWQIYKLYMKKDHDTRTLGDGLPWLLAAGAASLLSGLLGMMYELHRSALMAAGEVERSLLFLVQCALRCSAMMMVGLLTAIAIGIVWFVLMNKVRRIEIAEAAWLMEP